jgi:Arc/MetJ-type ribon-helix-helix transcriptional regulator
MVFAAVAPLEQSSEAATTASTSNSPRSAPPSAPSSPYHSPAPASRDIEISSPSPTRPARKTNEQVLRTRTLSSEEYDDGLMKQPANNDDDALLPSDFTANNTNTNLAGGGKRRASYSSAIKASKSIQQLKEKEEEDDRNAAATISEELDSGEFTELEKDTIDAALEQERIRSDPNSPSFAAWIALPSNSHACKKWGKVEDREISGAAAWGRATGIVDCEAIMAFANIVSSNQSYIRVIQT